MALTLSKVSASLVRGTPFAPGRRLSLAPGRSPPNVPDSPATADAAFTAAHAHFRAVFDPGLIDVQQPFGPAAVYTAGVVVHLLVLQRLAGNASLRHAVDGLLSDTGGPPANRRVGTHTLAANTAAYSRGRTRLAADVTRDLADRMAGPLIAACPPSLGGRRVLILDGTTASRPGTADLRRAFPPGRNRHGESHWPPCRMVAAHELAGGCAARPAWGPFNGPAAVDEVTLAGRLLPRLPANSVLMADRNFGIFAFATAAADAGHDVLTRLTGPRFRALTRVARADGPGRWALDWAPSKADRAGHPDWPADVSVRVRPHEVVVRDDLTLWLPPTPDEPAAALADLYRRRRRRRDGHPGREADAEAGRDAGQDGGHAGQRRLRRDRGVQLGDPDAAAGGAPGRGGGPPAELRRDAERGGIPPVAVGRPVAGRLAGPVRASVARRVRTQIAEPPRPGVPAGDDSQTPETLGQEAQTERI